MENVTSLLGTLQFCQGALSPLSHRAHAERLIALGYLVQPEEFPEQVQEALGIPLARYLYTLSVCRNLTDGDATHEKNLGLMEQFVRQRFPEQDADER